MLNLTQKISVFVSIFLFISFTCWGAEISFSGLIATLYRSTVNNTGDPDSGIEIDKEGNENSITRSQIELDGVELALEAKKKLSERWMAAGKLAVEYKEGFEFFEVDEAWASLEDGTLKYAAGIIQNSVENELGEADRYELEEMDDSLIDEAKAAIQFGYIGVEDMLLDLTLRQFREEGEDDTPHTKNLQIRLQFEYNHSYGMVRVMVDQHIASAEDPQQFANADEDVEANDAGNYREDANLRYLVLQGNFETVNPFFNYGLIQEQAKKAEKGAKEETSTEIGWVIGFDYLATEAMTITVAFNNRMLDKEGVGKEHRLNVMGIGGLYEWDDLNFQIGYSKGNNNYSDIVKTGKDQTFSSVEMSAEYNF